METRLPIFSLLAVAAENFSQSFTPESKDPLQGFSYKKIMQNPANSTVRNIIVDPVNDFYRIPAFDQLMVMIPEPVRADPLFINKGMLLPDVLDFRQPCSRPETGDFYPVLDDKPIEHGRGH